MSRKWEYAVFKMQLNRVKHETYKDKFFNACKCGLADKIYDYIQHLPYEVNHVVNQGFIIACENGQIGVVKKLLLCKNIKLNCGHGIVIADQKGHRNIVNLLIENDKSNLYDALDFACQNEMQLDEQQSFILIEHLLNYGADVDKCILYACQYGNMLAIRLLMRRGAKLTQRTWGITQQNGPIQLVQMHIDAGFEVPFTFIRHALDEQRADLSILLLKWKYEKTKQPYDIYGIVKNVNHTHNRDIAAKDERLICELLNANCQITHPNIKRIKKWRSHRNRRILAEVDNAMITLKLNFDVHNLKIIESYLSHEPKNY